MNISYNSIVSKFPSNEWDFSYLTFDEIQEVLNHPIKYDDMLDKLFTYGFQCDETSIFLVCIKKSSDFDYSLHKSFEDIIHNNIPELNYREFWCNFKYAAVLSGLGQYAKNSLFYHPIFQFETHIIVYVIHNKIIDLPNRKKPNFSLLSLCNNCNDCIKACPVSAINIGPTGTWIDLYKCDNFCHFGNHNIIPSMKWNWVKIHNFNLNYEEIYNIHNLSDCREKCGYTPSGCVKINNIVYDTILPVCRECTSQKKCSKYNGKYPYDWNNVKFIPR